MKKRLFIILSIIGLIACDDNDSYSNSLQGKWDWKSTCGGVVGCVYATEPGANILIIESNRIKITDHQQLTFEHQFVIKKITHDSNSTHYELELDNGFIWNAEVTNNTLDINSNVFGSSYNRII